MTKIMQIEGVMRFLLCFRDRQGGCRPTKFYDQPIMEKGEVPS